MKDLTEIFLPYQKRWLNDCSKVKLAAKSRRIGFTWIQSFEDVRDALTLKIRNKPSDVWFSSADESAAKEYIKYCKDWAIALNAGFKDLNEQIIDEEKGIKALSIEFSNGARINAISSNPSAFRSKGGKAVIDEFAFHKNPDELWKAARPVITWGYPLRIISSLNGANNLFYKFIQLIKKGKLNWSLHEISIQDAVNEGLVDKILDRKTSKEERENWLNEIKESCGDEITWLQEYCCTAVDEGSAFISYELINSCIEESLLSAPCKGEVPAEAGEGGIKNVKGDLYLGFDAARKKDLSVISVFEKLGSVFYLRKLYELKNVKYAEQKSLLRRLLNLNNTRRLAMDATGIGNQMSEELKDEYGSRTVEPVMFTQRTKEELAYKLLYAFQDRNIRIPDDEDIKNDIHSIKKMNTSTGALRFDAARSETDGHADRFWSFALAVYAGTNEPYIKPDIRTAKRSIYTGFNSELDLRALGGFLSGGIY